MTCKEKISCNMHVQHLRYLISTLSSKLMMHHKVRKKVSLLNMKVAQNNQVPIQEFSLMLGYKVISTIE